MAFATGTKVDPRLMQADFSGFARAAEIQAQGIQNLASGLSSGVEKFVKKKKDDKLKKQGTDYIVGFIETNPNLARSLGLVFEDDEGFYDAEMAKSSALDFVNVQGVDKLGSSILSLQGLAQKSQSDAMARNLARREELFNVTASDALARTALSLPNVSIEKGTGQILVDVDGKDVSPLNLPASHPMYQTFVDAPGSGVYGLTTNQDPYSPTFTPGGTLKYRPTIREPEVVEMGGEPVVENPMANNLPANEFEGFNVIQRKQ